MLGTYPDCNLDQIGTSKAEKQQCISDIQTYIYCSYIIYTLKLLFFPPKWSGHPSDITIQCNLKSSCREEMGLQHVTKEECHKAGENLQNRPSTVRKFPPGLDCFQLKALWTKCSWH